MKKTLLIAGGIIAAIIATILILAFKLFLITLLKAPGIVGEILNPSPINIIATKEAILFSNNSSSVLAVDPKNHKLKWLLDNVSSDYTFVGKMVYVSRNSEVLVVNASSGKIMQTIKTGIDLYGAPLIIDKTLILRDFGKVRTVFGYDLKTGKSKWRFETRKTISDCLSAGDGIICVGTTFDGFAPSKPE
ncbi:MAG: PQQ-binding-like beta-propeller repeat protein [Rubrobacteridae bacterium]|nr:PQQ-binding-like beta-propeller repeat protein [Rubrobacteridae bacterium]